MKVNQFNNVIDQLENGELAKCSALTDLSVLKQVLLEADKRYYGEGNSGKEPLLSDQAYDMLKDYVEERDPEFVKNEVGHAANVRVVGKKTKLPRWMGSMDKKKRLDKPITEEVVLSDKLDGVSCMLHYVDGKMALYTRGNGSVGQNISHLQNHINHLNTIEDKQVSELMVRGELIIPKITFVKLQDKESNARNTVSGFVNSKVIPEKLKKQIDFVAYEMVVPENVPPSEQFKYLKKHTKLKLVHHSTYPSLSHEEVSEYLKTRKLNSEYDIDGVIVAKDVVYEAPKSGNPKHAFAYKENSLENRMNTTVTEVKWQVSKDGYLKPTVHFQTIVINNVKISKATGHNAKFIVDNKIGKGAVIAVERSGDVIPKVVATIEGATVSGLPTNVSYKWNDTNTDILVDDMSNTEVDKKQFQNLIEKLSFDHMGKGTIDKLYDELNIRSILELYITPVEKLQTMTGFAKDSATKLYKSIRDRKTKLTLVDYMIASNIFGRGFGEKNLNLITSAYPVSISSPTIPSLQQMLLIDGIAEKRALQYIEGLPKFIAFVKQNQLDVNTTSNANDNKPVEVSSKQFENKVFLFTGFRDKGLEEYILHNSGKVESSLKKNVTHLVIKDKSATNSKIEKAKESGIIIMTKDELVAQTR